MTTPETDYIEVTQDQAREQNVTLLAANQKKVEALAKYERGPQHTTLLKLQLDALISVIVPDEAKPFVELEYHLAVSNYLDALLQNARESDARQGGFTPAQPSDVAAVVQQAQATGLIVPGRR